MKAQARRLLRRLKRGFKKVALRQLGMANEEYRAKMFARAAIPIINSLQPDVIWINDFNASRGVTRCKGAQNARIIYDSHEFWLGRNRPFSHTRFSRIVAPAIEQEENDLMCDVAAVVSVSSSILENLKLRALSVAREEGSAHGKDPAGKFFLVRNIPKIDPMNSDDEARIRASIGIRQFEADSRENLELFYTGLITSNRCLENCIDAIGQFNRHTSSFGKQIRLNLLGHGDPRFIDNLRTRGDWNDVSVCHHPPVPSSEVVSTLRAFADFCFVGNYPIHASYRMALPNKFFEGLLSSKVVIYPDLVEMRREAEGIPGMVAYNPFDTGSIFDAIREALRLRDSEFCRTYGHLNDENIISDLIAT